MIIAITRRNSLMDDQDLREWMREPLLKTSAVDSAARLDCRRCQSEWLGPAEPQTMLRRDVAEWTRASKVLDAFAALKAVGFAFRDAKPTVLHVSQKPGVCNRCSRTIASTPGSVVCRCGSLNLNW